jgi:hypothetical protein
MVLSIFFFRILHIYYNFTKQISVQIHRFFSFEISKFKKFYFLNLQDGCKLVPFSIFEREYRFYINAIESILLHSM